MEDKKATPIQSERNIFSLFSRDSLDRCVFRFVFYSIYAAFGSSITFVPLYFKQMGLDAAQVGVLTGMRPFIQALGAPLAGFIADKFKKRKLLLIIATLAYMGKHLGILLVDHPHQTCQLKTVNTTLVPNSTAMVYDEQDNHFEPAALNTVDTSQKFAEYTNKRLKSERRETQEKNTRKMFFYATQQDVDVVKKRKLRQINSVPSKILTDRTEAERTFIIVLLIIIVCEPLASSMASLLDGVIVEYLGDERNDYGKFRFWGSVGIGSTALITGAVIQKYGYYFCETPRKHYSITFYFLFGFGCLALIPSLLSKQIYSDAQDQHQSGFSRLKGLFCSIKNLSFWLAIIALAILDGFQMDFGPWFLDDLGASSFMIGASTAAHFAVNACTYMVSPYIVNRLGYMRVLSVGLFLHVVLFVLFSVANSSWFGVTLFSLVGFVPSLSMSCGTAYVGMVSTPLGIVSTAEGFFNGIYVGVGYSIGTIMGGAIIKVIGIRVGFRILASFSLLVLVIFNVLLYIDKKLTPNTNESSYEPLKMLNGDDQ